MTAQQDCRANNLISAIRSDTGGCKGWINFRVKATSSYERKIYMNVMQGFQYILPRKTSGTSQSLRQGEELFGEVVTVGRILGCSQSQQQALESELAQVFESGFPAKEDWAYFVWLCFHEPTPVFQRQVILLRNADRQLVATTIFDQCELCYAGQNIQAIYLIVSVVLPEYQGNGLAQFNAARILQDLRPDVLMTSCVQSAALHPHIGLLQSYSLPGFEVFPHLDRTGAQDTIVTFPSQELDFAIQVFRTVYAGFVHGNQERIERAIRNLTVLLARKNVNVTYLFHPWKKGERQDPVATALGLDERDGVLVVFRKTA